MMSKDTALFKAPKSYPEPPRDMWYQVPKEASKAISRLPPIFPWEYNQAPAKRVFPEDQPQSPDAESEKKSSPTLTDITTKDLNEDIDTAETTPITPTIHVSVPDTIYQPFATYKHTNAWDEIPAIQNYVERLYKPHRKSRGAKHGASISLSSIVEPSSPEELRRRRASLQITDFPTEDERPSLPVTPAPIRRSSFWGEDREAENELPAAEGVPRQQDWDPLKQLEELQRRQSETFLLGPISRKTLPQRELLGSEPSAVSDDNKPVSVSNESPSRILNTQPNFQSMDFATLVISEQEEAIQSPTDT